jgi:hypothetical protein
MRWRTVVVLAVSVMGCRQLLGIDTPIPDSSAPTDGPPDAPGSTTPVFVQGGSVNAATGSTLGVQLSMPLLAYDVLVVAVGATGSATGTIGFAVTDTAGTSFAVANMQTSFAGLNAETFYGEAKATSASDDVTVTFTAGGALDVRVAQYRNLADAATPAALGGRNSGTGSDATCTATVQVGSGGGLIVAANYADAATLAVGPGFTRDVSSSPDRGMIEHDYVDAENVVTAACMLGSARSWILQAMVFGTP